MFQGLGFCIQGFFGNPSQNSVEAVRKYVGCNSFNVKLTVSRTWFTCFFWKMCKEGEHFNVLGVINC